ncbi:hypothetical protein [Mucisphaera calidilacus]|uniref:LTD domain-containing protein n=1 Tax=Mucisphaera calidilacus TaxID=2527982 RepID=A0A518BXF1_9BACT|nr:hypothetical protein [Mucisphaera calidilacus]QDU71662.1 hypothetical protein Pan265_15140 [Mucisphaera calidilacus]
MKHNMKQHHHARRGSALLLTVGVLLLIFIAGIAFVSSGQSMRIAGSASARTANTDAAVQATVAYIGNVIAKDWTDYTDNPITGNSEYHDYPHPDVDPWLASAEPEDFSRLSAGQQTFLRSTTNYGGTSLNRLTGFIDNQLNGIDSDGDTDTNNDWDAWRNISRLEDLSGTPLEFIDLRYFRPIGENPPVGNQDDIYDAPTGFNPTDDTQTLTYHPVNAAIHGVNDEMNTDGIEANLNTAADADGDGYTDARWVELPINAPGGLRWAAAVRIIDETALANVNTATEIEDALPTTAEQREAMVLGTTPADLNLKRLLARADFRTTNNYAYWEDYEVPDDPFTQKSSGRRYDEINTSTLALNSVSFTNSGRSDNTLGTINTQSVSDGTGLQRDALYSHLGYYDPLATSALDSAGNLPTRERHVRDALWQAYGRNLDDRSSFTSSRPYDYPHDGTSVAIDAAYNPFGFDTLLELRTRFGINSPGWSPLEFSLFNDFDLTDSNAWSVLRSNRTESTGALTRRQLRMGVRHLLTTYSGSRQIRPYLTTAGSMPQTNSDLDRQARAKLNINELTTARFSLFESRVTEAGLTTTDAENMAASIYAYRMAGIYDDTASVTASAGNPTSISNSFAALTDFVTANNRLGLEPQPFFREVVALTLREDPAGDDNGDTNLNDPDVVIARHLIIELANPSTIDIDLTRYTIQIDGTPYTLTGTLNAGQSRLFYSDTAAGTSPLPMSALVTNILAQFDAVGPSPDSSIDSTADVLTQASDTAGFTTNARLELLYSDGTTVVMLDRMRNSTANWPSTTATDAADAQQLLTIQVSQREDSGTSDPHYIMEDAAANGHIETEISPYAGAVSAADIPDNFGRDADSGTTYPALTNYQLYFGKIRDGTATDFTAPSFDSVGELGLMSTSIYHDTTAGTEEPITERLNAEFAAGATPTRYVGRLDWTNVNTTYTNTDLHLPDAVHLMDQFTTLEGPDATATTNDALNDGMAFGVININTAPQRVLESLPYALGGNASENHPMGGTSPAPYLAEGIIDYRDLPDGGTYGNSTRTWPATVTWTGAPRTEPGFASIGELTMIREGSVSTEAFDRLQYDAAGNNGTAEGDFTDDTVADDLEEELLPFMRVASLVSVRSDVFTAYVLLEGRRPNADNPLQYDRVVQRRFIVTYDRSNVNAPGDQPRILMFAELN